MNNLRIAGMVLLWAGFLSGALAAVFNKEIVEDKWSTINWIWFAGSVIVGIGGVVCLQATRKTPVGVTGTAVGTDQLARHLENLVDRIDRLKKNHEKQTPRQTVNYIEKELHDDFREFANGREAITRELGLAAFAEVMTCFASGERAINRAWSASADGYVDEAARCIDVALDQLMAARKGLKAG